VDKLQRQASGGSLFLKHVFVEGVFLAGERQLWENGKSAWVARETYTDEIDDNLNFLSLLMSVPCTQEGCLAAVDIVACSVRNILVRRLAGQGEYVFSWPALIRAGTKHNLVGAHARRVLAWARHVKNLRRAGSSIPVGPEQVEELLFTFRKLLEGARFGLARSHVEIERAALMFDEWSYGRLRGYELLAATNQKDPSLQRLKQVTTSPSYFLSGRMQLCI
jgi:hypothetical protein